MKQPLMIVLILLLAVAGGLGITRDNMNPIGMGFYPEIYTFEALPDVLNHGGTATLTWASRGAAGLVLEARTEKSGPERTEILAVLPVSGEFKVHPDETTIYRLKCDTVLGLKCGNAELKIEVK